MTKMYFYLPPLLSLAASQVQLQRLHVCVQTLKAFLKSCRALVPVHLRKGLLHKCVKAPKLKPASGVGQEKR